MDGDGGGRGHSGWWFGASAAVTGNDRDPPLMVASYQRKTREFVGFLKVSKK